MILRRTEQAIEDLAADINNIFGQHSADELATAAPGLVVAERQYQPGRDSTQDIDHSSLSGIATDTYFVEETLPERPLSISIIEYRDPMEAALETQEDYRLRSIWFGKQALSKLVVDALIDCLPGNEDIVDHYIVGLPTKADLSDRDTEIIKNTEDPMEAAKKVEEIAAHGLSVLIGSMRLPLENVSGGDYSTLLAVKADHFYNRRLIPDKSIWRTGHPQMPEVDTSDPKQLASWNAFLDLQHQKRINQLELAGIVVAPVVYQPQLRPYKIDVIATDNSLSRGFEQIGKKL